MLIANLRPPFRLLHTVMQRHEKRSARTPSFSSPVRSGWRVRSRNSQNFCHEHEPSVTIQHLDDKRFASEMMPHFAKQED